MPSDTKPRGPGALPIPLQVHQPEPTFPHLPSTSDPMSALSPQPQALLKSSPALPTSPISSTVSPSVSAPQRASRLPAAKPFSDSSAAASSSTPSSPPRAWRSSVSSAASETLSSRSSSSVAVAAAAAGASSFDETPWGSRNRLSAEPECTAGAEAVKPSGVQRLAQAWVGIGRPRAGGSGTGGTSPGSAAGPPPRAAREDPDEGIARRAGAVTLNVYDIVTPDDPGLIPRLNGALYHVGVGLFHSGVEVYGTEYAFGGHFEESSGVFTSEPRGAEGVRYRCSLELGFTALTEREVVSVVEEMGSKEFSGNKYSLVKKNCNSFSAQFVEKLGTESGVPAWVNRMATIACNFSCILPEAVERPLSELSPTDANAARRSSFGVASISAK